MNLESSIEVWGGLECTINRVGDNYHDQFEFGGYYNRTDDMDLIGSLGITKLRFPVIWERHQAEKDGLIDWAFTEQKLNRLKELDIEPIAGLVHHGSGPRHVSFFDGTFEEGLAHYARAVAERFPSLGYYTPVNEPLTTARFCGLYGHWYPHGTFDYSFYKILLSECKATIMAMNAIWEVNPKAKLIQTEDLGKCYSTELLKYQADLENERRWISYELLTGRLTPDKLMYKHILNAGIEEKELQYFLENNVQPDIAGFNYYITSERFLDEDKEKYPAKYHGGNGRHEYADIEIVKVQTDIEWGPSFLLKEAWERLHLPMAITECHLHSTREEQMRWFNEIWETLNELKDEGIDIRAITAWAVFGLYGWNKLVTEPYGTYEPGVFNLSSGRPKPTALARLIRILTKRKVYYHPVLETEGWWKREDRLQFPLDHVLQKHAKQVPKCPPVLIIGQTGTLGNAISKICEERNIHHIVLSRADLNITDRETFDDLMDDLKPWAIINAAGFAKVDEAEQHAKECFESNCHGPSVLADICKKHRVKLLTFSSGYVFDGTKKQAYTESDPVSPINVYGKSKAEGESSMLAINPHVLIIRTSHLFSSSDDHSQVSKIMNGLQQNRPVYVANDVHVSPTFVPDMVNESLDLLLDNESGIFHIANEGSYTWADIARLLAKLAGLDHSLIQDMPLTKLNTPAIHPKNMVLTSQKGVVMPTIEAAINRYLEASNNEYFSDNIAV